MSITRVKNHLQVAFIAFLLVAMVFAGAGLPRTARAASICFVDADAIGPIHNGQSWQTAFLTFQDALASSECTSQVWIAAGVYTPSTSRGDSLAIHTGVAYYGGFDGSEDTLEDRVLHLDDADFTNDTVISGEIGDPGVRTDNSRHILTLSDSMSNATLMDGFVISDAYSEDPSTGEGGAFLIMYSTLSLSHVTFRNNYTINKGGALSAGFSELHLSQVVFENNSTDGIGGAIHEYQSPSTYADITVRDNVAGSGGAAYLYQSHSTFTGSVFSGNTALSGDGGALIITEGSPSFTNVTFRDNQASGPAAQGGGILIGPGSSPSFKGVTIANNHSNGPGGGVYNTGPATFDEVLFSGNMAGTVDEDGNPILAAAGGGMFIYDSAPLLTNVRILNNAASNMGGGISHSYLGLARIVDSIFSGNVAYGDGGGGIECNGPHSNLTLINTTITHNSAPNGQGGGLLAHNGGPEGTHRVYNSIFWANTSGSGNTLDQLAVQSPTQLVITYSDIQDGFAGLGNINADPLFVDIDGADGIPGNADDNLQVNWSSPVIDAGSNTALGSIVSTDFAGNPRFANILTIADTGEGTAPIVDMGAYEVQPPNLQVSKVASPTTAPEGQDISYTITVSNSGFGTAHQVTISDPLPANLQRVVAPAIVPPGAGTPGVAPVLFEGITLEPGESVTVTYTARVLDGPATAVNTVTVTAFELPAPGLTSAATVTINNAAPSVDAGTDREINEGATESFSGSYTDPAGVLDAPYSTAWTFSDSATPVNGTLTTTHAYPDDGNYTATLSVTDGDGATGSDTVNIHVLNVAPTVNAGSPVMIDEGRSVSFAGTASDPGADTLTYSWNFQDGSPAVTGTLTPPAHTFVDNGIYDVTLTVNDGDGGITVDTVRVTVQNVAPTANAGADQNTFEGTQISVSGSFTDPGVNDTHTFSWNFGDSTGPVTGQSATHTYVNNGSYTVTLTVTDKDGGVGTDTLTIAVANVAPTNVNAGPDRSGFEGVSLSFTGSATDPGSADVLTYTWNFGDTQSATGQTVTHAYADNGTYTVTLTVSDGNGGSSSDTASVTIANVVPAVNAGLDQTVDEGISVQFTGTALDVPADTLTYNWNFGDGGSISGTRTPTHPYADNGTYTVTFTVTDDDSGISSDTMIVTVDNVAPVVDAGANRTVNEGQQVSFSGTATDVPADPLTLTWDFGDGGTASNTLTPTHTFANNGSYTVRLTANDGDDGVMSDTLTVTVNNVAPTIDAGANQPVDEGAFVNFNGTATDPGADTLTYNWTFGDGSTASGSLTPTHAYGDNGSYTVTLRVSDGEVEVTDTLVVTVANVTPRQLNAGPDQIVKEGELVHFSGSFTDPGTLDTHTITWNFGDGNSTTGTNLTPTHTYANDGSYLVTMTVEDDDHASAAATLHVTVDNVAPSVNPGGDQTATEGQLLTFSGTATDPGADTLTYTWAFGDGGTATGSTATHAYGDNGSYTVTLTVSDGKDSTSSTLTVTVSNVIPQTVDAGSNQTVNEGDLVTFSGSFTDPGTLDTHTIAWDFGDASSYTGTAKTTTHTYADDGVYTVTMTVTDDDGGSASDMLTVTVHNVAPVVNAGGDVFIKPGDTVNFSGAYTDPGGDNDAPYTIAWNFGDGTTASGVLTPSHTYALPGKYTITLTVTDADGAAGTDTLTVEVSNFVIYLPMISGPGAE